ncbi:flavodoxin domain-containing protein [Chitinophaga rhizosphaerae]|uniref:flavodoxin domain-containing protein n=1 Tax=Chitinophaga rhizosphaerae TaxID=1864947 RepID=UPI000F804579|nr:flavodoxin domain-containing protein [Chitinophaga rhizosphaerae]
MKGLVVYKGKYGATMQYGIWLGAALNWPVVKSDFVRPEQITQAECILIGTSVYIGRLQVKQWLQANLPLLEGKRLIFFVVAGGVPDNLDEVKTYVEKGVPDALQPGAECFYLPGRLHFGLLSLKDKILLRIGAWFAARKGKKIKVTDYDHVSREHIAPVIEATLLMGTAAMAPQNNAL